MALRLIIAGLRRSGTTIFWRTFRQDSRFVCYDEPFNPHLCVLPAHTRLKAPEEFVDLIRADPRAFWEAFTPIHFTQELKTGFSDREAAWLRFLAGTGEAVALDTTRCAFKISALRKAAPAAVLVHLYRPPASLASSHLLPSSEGRKGQLKRWAARRGFWSRADRYNGWSFESIVGESTSSFFAERLRDAGLDAETVYGLPAVGRLLAYWKVCFERIERDGRREFGDRFVSQSFDRFCRQPEGVVRTIYEVLGMTPPEPDFSAVHPARGPFEPASPHWKRYRRLLDLPEVE